MKIRKLGGIFRLPQILRLSLRKAFADTMSSSEYVDLMRKNGVMIGENVNFRYPSHTLIDTTRPCLVEIGNNIDINDNFSILTHDFGTFVFREYYHDFVNSSGKVTIGDNIVFGRNVTILKGVSIGNNCIIGSGSIVSKSIPDNSVAVGVPARVICSLDEYYHKRKKRQLDEALEYGVELAKSKGGADFLEPSDFPEEWVLFLSKEDYDNNIELRDKVNFRLKDRIDINEFLKRNRPYSCFQEFKNAIKQELTENGHLDSDSFSSRTKSYDEEGSSTKRDIL